MGNKAKPLIYEHMSALSETRPSASGSDRIVQSTIRVHV